MFVMHFVKDSKKTTAPSGL